MSKKHKFDLTHLVHNGSLKNGEILAFVSDPAKTCQIAKQPNGEYKVTVKPGKDTPKAPVETMTIHSFVQKCLSQDPPDHASKWLKSSSGKTLYELWHAEDMEEAA